jgi:hypothetical protein
MKRGGKKGKTGRKKEATKKKSERIRGRHECNISEQQILIPLSHFEYSRLDQLFQGTEARRCVCVCVCVCVTHVVRFFPHFGSCKPTAHPETHRVQRPFHTHLLPTAPPLLLSTVRCDECAELCLFLLLHLITLFRRWQYTVCRNRASYTHCYANAKRLNGTKRSEADDYFAGAMLENDKPMNSIEHSSRETNCRSSSEEMAGFREAMGSKSCPEKPASDADSVVFSPHLQHHFFNLDSNIIVTSMPRPFKRSLSL